MIKVDIRAAQTQLMELVQKAISGEEVIIERDNKPLVKLVAFQPIKRQRTLGLGKGLVTMAADFNDPLGDYKDYEK